MIVGFRILFIGFASEHVQRCKLHEFEKKNRVAGTFDDYTAVLNAMKYTSLLIQFCFSILELKLHYYEKVIMRRYKVVAITHLI